MNNITDRFLVFDWRLLVPFIALLYVFYFIALKKNRLRIPFVFFSVFLGGLYLFWRLLFTIPFSVGIGAAVFGSILFLAEFMGFVQSLIFKTLLTRPHEKAALPEGRFSDADLPTVDVLVATYNESTTILKKTLAACLNLDYPKDKLSIYLCDDGRRTQARLLCEQLGTGYLTRTDNAHAKAGNINSALKTVSGDLVMLLDADMVPRADFLRKTIHFFTDEQTGFVQTPQVFYNPDPFQYNLKLYKRIPDEQDLFMHDIERGRSYFNAVLHVGTNAVFRRSAIDTIGGVPVGTITEDMATGMLIQAHGYKTYFLDEVLCTGLSVETFADLITQRERWCRGNIQVSKKWNPLTVPGLNFMQRIIYADGLLYWFFGIQKMIFILSPLLFMLTGIPILNANIRSLLLLWLPQFISQLLAFKLLVPKHRSLFWSHIYEIAMAPYIALAALMEAVFSRPLPFKVTPKGVTGVKTHFAFRAALPQIVLLFLSVAALAYAVTKLFRGGLQNTESFIINTVWTLYNGVGVFYSILTCIERPRKRVSERVHVEEPAELHVRGNVCRLVDVSETGAMVVCDTAEEAEHIPDTVSIETTALGRSHGRVVRRKKTEKGNELGVEFDGMDSEGYKKIVKLFSDKDKGYKDN